MDISKTLRRTIFRLGLVEGSVLRPFWLALGVTLAYIALLSTYIYVSGHVAAVVASSKEGLARIEQIKGLLYDEGFTISGARKKLRGAEATEARQEQQRQDKEQRAQDRKTIRVLKGMRGELRELIKIVETWKVDEA